MTPSDIVDIVLGADDPHIRVASAVHLAFEDETKGREALRKLSELPGDAGALGGIDARALWRTISHRPSCRNALANHDNLTAGSLLRPLVTSRLLEVVSNTAAAHNLPTPAWLGDEDSATRVKEFFARNPHINPVDPWFTELRRQKVD